MVASFGVGVQLARGMGVTGYGYYGIALSVITIAGIPGELGIPRLVTREIAAAGARKDFAHFFGVLRWARRTVFRISALMMLGVVFVAAVLAATRPSQLAVAMLLGAPVIPFMAFARLEGGALQGLHHIIRGQIPANLVRPMVLSLLLFTASAMGVVVAAPAAMGITSMSAAVAALVAYIWLKQRLPNTAPPEIVRTGRRWLASSVPMAMTDGMRTVQSELSILLLGLLTAPAEVGLFRVASVTAMTAAAVIPALGHATMPMMARLHAQDDRARLQKLVTAAARTMFAGVLLLSMPLLLGAGPLLSLVFGSSYAPAADVVRVLASAQIISTAFGPNVALLNMTGHERRVTRAILIGLVVDIVLVLVLTPLWGRIGTAFALFAAFLAWNLQTWFDARRLLGIETSIVPLRWARLRRR
jgi:O-antigen/teichoic acid export membrane protein